MLHFTRKKTGHWSEKNTLEVGFVRFFFWGQGIHQSGPSLGQRGTPTESSQRGDPLGEVVGIFWPIFEKCLGWDQLFWKHRIWIHFFFEYHFCFCFLNFTDKSSPNDLILEGCGTLCIHCACWLTFYPRNVWELEWCVEHAREFWSFWYVLITICLWDVLTCSRRWKDIAGTVPQRWVGGVPTNIYDPPEIRSRIWTCWDQNFWVTQITVRPLMSFHDPHDIPGAQAN